MTDPTEAQYRAYLDHFKSGPVAVRDLDENHRGMIDALIVADYLQFVPQSEEVYITENGVRHLAATAPAGAAPETTATAAYDMWATADPAGTQREFATHADAVAVLGALHHNPPPGHRGFERGEFEIRDLGTLAVMDVCDFLTLHTDAPTANEGQDHADKDREDPNAPEVYTSCECGKALPEPTTDPEATCADCDPNKPEVYTSCECGEALPEPTTDPEAMCADCDPNAPTYLLGSLTRDGTRVNPKAAEFYKRFGDLIEDTYDMVLEQDVPRGDTYIQFPDGSLVDAREWIERPDILAQSTGRTTAPQFDPEHPDRCFLGTTLPSGLIARWCPRKFDDVADLAREVCKRVYEPTRKREEIHPGTHTVMLPGGAFVDAAEWAALPETRQLGGAPVSNLITFEATGTCRECGTESSATVVRTVQGQPGETCRVAAAVHCDTCPDDVLLPPVFVSVTLHDDTSATDGIPRPVG